MREIQYNISERMDRMAKLKKTVKRPAEKQDKEITEKTNTPEIDQINAQISEQEKTLGEQVDDIVVPVVIADRSPLEHIEITIEFPKAVENAVEIPKIEPMYFLEQAVHMLLAEPREHWMPGIRARANYLGINTNKPNTLEEWRRLLVIWGGTGLLK
jgi:hypothetical protein